MPANNIASLIFPPLSSLPQAISDPVLLRQIMTEIHNDPTASATFRALSSSEQEAFLGFCMGNRGLKITYDPFFQYLFHPNRYPERLDRLLSCILEQPAHIQEILPRERTRISSDGSLIIMDILVSLEDGSLVAVEMQRIGYDFPIERGFCYGADLLVRQYDLARKRLGKGFSYQDIRPVYVIVLMEKSPGIFHWYPDRYIHRSHFSFNTGLKLSSMENFIYIPLDIFREMPHNNLTELEAWLYFLASDTPEDILRIVNIYPFFQELYKDIINFRYHPKEMIAMYSEALSIMDRNTVKYMIDELKEELKQQLEENQKQKKENQKQLEENQKQQAENQRLQEEIKEMQEQIRLLLARPGQ